MADEVEGVGEGDIEEIRLVCYALALPGQPDKDGDRVVNTGACHRDCHRAVNIIRRPRPSSRLIGARWVQSKPIADLVEAAEVEEDRLRAAVRRRTLLHQNP